MVPAPSRFLSSEGYGHQYVQGSIVAQARCRYVTDLVKQASQIAYIDGNFGVVRSVELLIDRINRLAIRRELEPYGELTIRCRSVTVRHDDQVPPQSTELSRKP